MNNLFESGESVEEVIVSILEITTPASAIEDKTRPAPLRAKLKAEAEFEVFRQRQDAEYVSDFDREVKRIQGRAKDRPQT